jgi:hypothetical protein
MQPAQGTRLDSWKTIAEYLDRNVRTVTRWADQRGLPVHRVPGGRRGAVFAFKEEIDAWLIGQDAAELESEGRNPDPAGEAAADSVPERTKENPGGKKPVLLRAIRWRIALPALVVVIGAATVSTVLHPVKSELSQLASVQYGTSTLEGKAADGRTIWVHKYAQTFTNPKDYFTVATGMQEGFRLADFLGDGRREAAVVVPLRSGPNPYDLDQPQIDFFGTTGDLLWSYLPDRTFRFGDHELKAPWSIQDLLVTTNGGHARLWAIASHHTWGNAFVVQLDPRTGHDALRFVNTGLLRRLGELKTAQGTYLLAGGFNNEWDSGILAIISEDRAFAASPQTPGTRHFCDSCPAGVPDYYFVFPRSEINRVAHVYEDSVSEIRLSEDGIEVSKNDAFESGREYTLYLLRRELPFSVVSLRYNSDYDRLHREWSANGKLNHTLENCPERMHPQPVRLWTSTDGWTELPVKPARANQ